ncbi:hypothetical protein [Klebsiella pneumoniae]|uniref:hypothetical protein n=1 Tax=Klebsiella pneumoniae TaxID=573 RepID=UPI000F4D4A40|nr:hypothetical protein [Klebsiella pneumoniae]AYY23398.1 hypothetical protein EGY03_20435 [Klebsiella pneumoniae]MCQ0515137.1 hypothetical protein [Klebsiella pneumoniae]MDR4630334.1 hypothetical protein [Klebsiella pneumoniae]HBQ6744759.1 hypothetical protein [Klebsiella pneumoniae]HCA3660710.1 hypothetical protein [Klebsiella pneumoniae]
MNIETVNELIASLESAGELSIKETKVMALAKAFKQLAVENVQIKAMNDCLSEELRGYESDGAFEGPKMHLLWWQVETPVTDAYLAGIKADGVEEFIGRLQQHVDEGDFVGDEVAVIVGAIDCGKEFCEQLREGAK